MKLIHALFIIVLAAFTIDCAEAASKPNKVNYVFIQNAETAILEPIHNKPDTYKLTLLKVRPYINYFSERPYRMTGMMPAGQFFKGWNAGKDSFAVDLPNVSVSGIKVHGLHRNEVSDYILALGNPQYNAKNNMMTYQARLLTNSPAIKKPVVLKDVVIFLDDGWCPSCCCG